MQILLVLTTFTYVLPPPQTHLVSYHPTRSFSDTESKNYQDFEIFQTKKQKFTPGISLIFISSDESSDNEISGDEICASQKTTIKF